MTFDPLSPYLGLAYGKLQHYISRSCRLSPHARYDSEDELLDDEVTQVFGRVSISPLRELASVDQS